MPLQFDLFKGLLSHKHKLMDYDVTVIGTFTVKGSIVQKQGILVHDVLIEDNIILLNNGETGAGVTLNVAGIEIDRGTLDNVSILFNEALGQWVYTMNGTNFYPIGLWSLNGTVAELYNTLSAKITNDLSVTSLGKATEYLVSINEVTGKFKTELPTDASLITDVTIIAALLLETNWVLETYIGITVGAVEGQYYSGDDYLYFYDNSTFKRIPVSTNANIKIASATIAASAALNTTGTLVSIGIPIPKNTLVAGSTYEITLFGTCTSSNADTSTFTGRIGTLNTIADAALFTKTLASAGSGSNIPFCLKIRFTVRTIGATATIYGHIELMNEGTTGIYTAVTQVGALTSVSTHDSTANNYLNISYVTNAVTTTTTFQNVIIQKIR